MNNWPFPIVNNQRTPASQALLGTKNPPPTHQEALV